MTLSRYIKSCHWKARRRERGGLELFQGRDDPFEEEVLLACLADAEQGAVGVGEAEFGRVVELLDRALDVLAVLAQVEAGLRGLLDLVVVPADSGAVLAEHLQLVRRLIGVVEGDIARVGVLGDQAQRLLLTAAADEDRRARAGERLR